MCTVALFTIGKLGNQCKYPLTDEWRKKMGHIYIYICIYIHTNMYVLWNTTQPLKMKSCHLQHHELTWRVLC